MDSYLGEIKIFAGNFAPSGWHLCDGSILQISQNDALFSLIGTTYGGNGQNTFALPDLRGRIVVSQGSNQGQSYVLGSVGGVESVTLTNSNLPAHNHPFLASSQPGTATKATGNVLAAPADTSTTSPQTILFYMPSTASGFIQHQLNTATLSPTGGSQPHENRMPFVGINYIICMAGIYPSSN